ncbi:ATP-dependent DNA helicase PIF1-like protein [Tanacetum coccineum]
MVISGATTKCKSRKATKGVALTSRGAEVSYHNIDEPSYQCIHCNASLWYEERINKGNRAVNPSFSLCCQEGKLRLPKFKPTPQPLHNLLNYNDPATTLVNGQSYHKIGSLLPKEGTQPRYAQLWFFDTTNEVRNRMGAFIDKDNSDAVDATTVQSLIQMLDRYSSVAKAFRMARDWCHSHASINVELHLLSERTNARQYNKPTVAEVATLITNDFGDGIHSGDIIVNKLHSGPKRISELHPAYMALQYPLLFPYGEDGFHDKIPYYSNIVVYVIEFQKRGLPHAHILLWLEDNNKCKTTAQIDDIISAELSSPTDDPDGYKAVTDYMLHGPCGKDGRYALCTTEGKCSKHYPKQFYTETVLDEDGYPIYHRRDNKASFKKGKFTFDNRHVVPHNRYLLLKYQAHINVEWCNRSKAIKYLFKYLNKGPDRATIVIQENVRKGDHVTAEKVVAVDEINNYLNCRYLAPCEAVWWLFSFDIHYSYPSVMKLNFHLPNQNSVTLRDSEFLPALLEMEVENVETTKTEKMHWQNRLLNPSLGRAPLKLWEETWEFLFEDILHRKQKLYNYPELQLSIEQIQNYCLIEIQELLNRNGRSLTDFQDLPRPNPQLLTNMDNRLIREALNFDMNKSRIEHERLHPLLNPKQRLIYEHVIHSVHNQRGQFHFVYGPGGTGKTFLYNTIIARLRTERKIVLAVASSANHLGRSTYDTKYAFEALDKTLRDILGFQNPEKREQIFGGTTMLLGGDFRQILPVIPKGKSPDVVQACLNRSELWKHCNVFTLTRSMIVNEYYPNGEIDNQKQEFNQWVLSVGNGNVPAKAKDGEDEPTWIQILEQFLIKSSGSPIENIVAETYPNFIERQHDDEYLKERAILTPRNDDVDEINTYMFNKLSGKSVTYNSDDEICKASTESLDQQQLYPTKFLNTLNFSGMPPHALCLKKELPIMLLRNVNPTKELCNRTRLIITKLGEFVIHAKILTGSHVGDNVLIHKIIITSNQSKMAHSF